MALNIVRWNGKAYRFDLDSPQIGEMATIREFTGLNWIPMLEELREGNFMALSAAMWLMLMRNGEPCNIDETPWPDGLGPMNFLYAISNAEPVGVADPNPPAAAGSIPSLPEPSTSETSEAPTSILSPGSESRLPPSTV